jgi:flagellar assembly factor FliW
MMVNFEHPITWNVAMLQGTQIVMKKKEMQ